MQEIKNIFENLKTDSKSLKIIFWGQNRQESFKKAKKSSYSKDKVLLKRINLIENHINEINKTNEDQIPTRLDYV